MKKKLLSLFLFSGLLGILGCCGEQLHHWDVTDFEIWFSDGETDSRVDSLFEGDTLKFSFTFTPEFIAQNSNFQNPFITSAMATKCPRDGDLGLIDPITNIRIYSDTDFNDFKAGEDLISLFTIKGDVFGLDNLLKRINDLPYYSGSLMDLHLGVKPLNNATHTFRAVFEFESRGRVEDVSESIIWM